jgi:hypothetical protein
MCYRSGGEKATAEQRRAERESTYKAARIGAGSRATLHCGVRNLSATRMCRVMWRSVRQIGVRFE